MWPSENPHISLHSNYQSANYQTISPESSSIQIVTKIRILLSKDSLLPESYRVPWARDLYAKLSNEKSSILGFDIIWWHVIVDYSWNRQKVFSLSPKWDSEVAISELALTRENLLQIAYRKEQETVIQISETLSDLEVILNAMDEVFEKNTWALWNGTLDKDDVFYPDRSVSPWKDISDIPRKVDLLYLQQLAQNTIDDVKGKLTGSTFPEEKMHETRKRLWIQAKRYIDFTMWLSEDYEWWAALFKEGDTELEDNPETPEDESIKENIGEEKAFQMIDLMLESMTPNEMLQYMVDTHYKLDRNQYQSTEVERSYRAWKHKVHTSVLDIFKANKVEDKYFLEYSKIVTGRPWKFISQQVEPGVGKSWYHNNRIDDRYRDPEAAQDALLYVCHRENGIISKIQTDPESNFKVEDPKMWNLDPIDVVDLVSGSIERQVSWMERTNSWEILLIEIGFQDIVNSIKPDTKYHDLDIEQKMKLAILLRVHDELNWKKSQVGRDKLADVFLDAVHDGQEVLVESFEKNFNDGWFGAKSAEYFNLTGVDSEIFELYMDIAWVGFWDVADGTKSAIWGVTKVVGLIWASILFGIWMLSIWVPLVAAAAAWWAVTVPLSVILHPKWYDNYIDMTLDLWSDLVISTVSAGWVAKLIHLWKVKDTLALTGAEIAAWIPIEMLRSWWVEYFQGSNRYSLPEFYEFVEVKSKDLRAMRDA